MYQKAVQIVKDLNDRLESGSDGASMQQLTQTHPWYAGGWLSLALNEPTDNALREKLGVFIQDPLRIHLLVHTTDDDHATTPVAIAAPQAAVTTPPMPAPTAAPEADEMEPTVETVAVSIEEQEEDPTEATTIATPEAPVKPVEDGLPASIAAVLSKAAENADGSDFIFQPYHTVDYFASLGIKMDPSLLGTTRFDTQLKSFTQWLKTMKKVDYQGPDKAVDPAVTEQATASLEAKEIITETMADVLEKQGKHDQAIELYAKLTLLHPEKSVFFAAQIQKIKEQQ